MLSVPQEKYEALLEKTLLERGNRVKRGVEIVGLVQREEEAGIDCRGVEEIAVRGELCGWL